MNDGEHNTYSFHNDGRDFRLIPLPPNKVREMKIQQARKCQAKYYIRKEEDECKNGSAMNVFACREETGSKKTFEVSEMVKPHEPTTELPPNNNVDTICEVALRR